MGKHLFSISLCLCLVGCQTAGTQDVSNEAFLPLVQRSEAEQRILDERSTIWKDPYSIRESKISDVIACPRGSGIFPAGSSCTCVEVNAKNGFGGYTGLKRTVIIFHGKDPLTAAAAGTQGFPEICGNNLEPFPKLNGDYVEPGAPKPKNAK